jgi:hypothetical protein
MHEKEQHYGPPIQGTLGCLEKIDTDEPTKYRSVSVLATDPSSPFFDKHFQYSIEEYALAATMQALDDALSDAAYHDAFFNLDKVGG